MKKRKLNLGLPPKKEEVKNNLDEPEFAPSEPKEKKTKKKKDKIDGRSLRKTGYTELLGFRVPKDFKPRFAEMVKYYKKNNPEERKITLGKVAVMGLEQLEKQIKKNKR